VDVQAFLADYEHAKKTGPSPRLDIIRETLASAYSKSFEVVIAKSSSY
jgi:hypothetical protein